jgi:uncharacterized protein
LVALIFRAIAGLEGLFCNWGVALADQVGVVSELWRFPVKSMAGEQLKSAEVATEGVVGDRAYALIDEATGYVVSGKSVRLFGGILDCAAAFVEPPTAGRAPSPVRITLPGGEMVTSQGGHVDSALSDLFGRRVRLAFAAPADFTIDQHHPDVEGVDPAGRRNVTVQQKLGAAFFAQAGAQSPVPASAFFDLFPMSVITTSTLRRLAELRPASRFDPRRFRMNVVLDTEAVGFVENSWLSRLLAIGSESHLRVAMLDPRCVMTTQPQGDLPQDVDIIRTLVEHNSQTVVGDGRFPCAGVYAVVGKPGKIQLGDLVTIE